jgi:succinate-acetate transporter protein
MADDRAGSGAGAVPEEPGVHGVSIDAPHASESVPPPVNEADVRVGAGGEPLALGAAAFFIGALTVGMTFIGAFPPAAVGVGVPVAIFLSGLALTITALWGLFRGETLLTEIFGIVAGLFTSFGILLLGLAHNWFAIPPAAVPAAEGIYFIAFCCWFALLLIPSVKLPFMYTFTIFWVVVSLALAAAGELVAVPELLQGAGAGFLLIALCLAVFLTNANTASVGMKPWPPLGQPLLK